MSQQNKPTGHAPQQHQQQSKAAQATFESCRHFLEGYPKPIQAANLLQATCKECAFNARTLLSRPCFFILVAVVGTSSTVDLAVAQAMPSAPGQHCG